MRTGRDWRNIGIGFGAGLVVSTFWPSIRESARPVTKAAFRSMFEASERLKTLSAEFQEEVEDIAAEVQQEKAHSTNSSYTGGDGRFRG